MAFIHSMEAIQALLKELAKLEHSITSWSDVNDAVSMYLNLQEQIEGPWSPARKEFPLGRTDALLGSAGLAMDNNAFPNAYIFQDMVEARAFGRYLQAKVYLASAARRLKALIHVRFSWRADGEIARLGEASEMEHMDDLCSCVPVMCTPDNGLGGKASALIFLMLGTPFYKHHGISEKHRWCEELSASLEKLGVTL